LEEVWTKGAQKKEDSILVSIFISLSIVSVGISLVDIPEGFLPFDLSTRIEFQNPEVRASDAAEPPTSSPPLLLRLSVCGASVASHRKSFGM
jgi:hypothetical protein